MVNLEVGKLVVGHLAQSNHGESFLDIGVRTQRLLNDAQDLFLSAIVRHVLNPRSQDEMALSYLPALCALVNHAT